MKNLLLFLISVLLMPVTLWAQERTLTGKVSDENGDPLPGVSVMLKGTTEGSITDFNGVYTIKVSSDENVVVFRYVGYKNKEITVGSQTTFDWVMEVDAEQLEEIVVIGYGQVEKKDVTGAMSSMKAEDFNQGSLTSPDQLMQGRAAGVVITPATGEPGAGVNIRIRGGTSLTASNEPLYVIDGFPIDNTASDPGNGQSFSASAAKNPLASLNPNDIESIDILKDASATAIYGARGANGVIIITTKKGATGRPTVSYDMNVGVAKISKKLDVLTADEYREYTSAAGSNPLDEGANTDWQDALTQNALNMTHNLSVAGGTQMTKYRVSLNYMDQEGIMIGSGVERISMSANLSQKVSEKVSFGFTMQGSIVKDDNLSFGTGGATNGGVINNMIRMSPLLPLDWQSADQLKKNPYLLATDVRDNTHTQRMRASSYVEWEIIEGLNAKANFGGDVTGAKRTMYLPGSLDWVGAGNGIAEIATQNLSNVLAEATLNYAKTFGEKHRINVLAGYTVQTFGRETTNMIGSGFTIDDIAEHNIEQASTYQSYSYKEDSKLASWIGRANYSYNDRYIITATVRADGSSRFGENNKWGVFPSTSVAWRLSEENFLADNEFFTDLKLRAGWGVTGSQEIGNYRSLPIVNGDPSKSVIDENGNIITGIGLINYANPDLKWEETSSTNIGLDFEFIEGRIYGSLEYYSKNTYDLLLEMEAPQPAPIETYLANVGEVKNSGFEFSLGTVNIDKNDFKWETSINGAFNKNEVISIGDREEILAAQVGGRGQVGQYAQIVRPGLPFGTFYGFKYLGVDNEGNEIYSEEKEVLGNAQPDFTWGMNNTFSFKNFDFSFFFQGSHGNEVFNNTALEFSQQADLYGPESTYNVLKSAVEEGTNAASYSSRFIEDGSFVRLSNMSLGYNFNMNKVKSISKLRVYVTGQNLLLFTDYTGYDPEVNVPVTSNQVPAFGVDYNNYPRARTFLAGLSVSF